MLRKFPEMFEPLFCGFEKIGKIPVNFPAEFPCQESKKCHQRASAGVQGEQL